MTDSKPLPITDATWQRLVAANEEAVANGWAQPGIFGTGVGPDYRAGTSGSILYVGKSAGPRGSQVGSTHHQAASIDASTTWMIERRNKSAFWQMIDSIDRTRRTLAWTNVCKMDRQGGTDLQPKPTGIRSALFA